MSFDGLEDSHSVEHREILSRAQAVAPVLLANADKTEDTGTLAAESVAVLRESGLFSILVPTELGGLGAGIVAAIDAIELLSRADGSSGWALMANGLATGIAAAYLGDRAVDEIFGASSGRAIVAGMLGPGGTCVVENDGYRGSGRYHFGSGVNHADWIAAGMTVTEGGTPVQLSSGLPEVRVCILPRSAVELRGNWDVMGLVGTGSVDYAVAERWVGPEFTFERTSVDYLRGGPVFSLGVAGMACAGHGAVALGIAGTALGEVAALADSKRRPGYASVVGDHPVFLHGFASHEAAYQSARAYLRTLFGQAEADLVAGRPLTGEQRQRFRQAVTHVHDVTAEVVRWCYTWGGSEALRTPNRLGRALLDMAGATQHVFVDQVNLVDAGAEIARVWRDSANSARNPELTKFAPN